MKTSHTPGPLFVGRFSEGDYNVTDADGGNVLASGIEKIEDAKLFAAAPDLLEACMLVNEVLNTHFGVTDEEEGGNDAHDSIRKAIKKATE